MLNSLRASLQNPTAGILGQTPKGMASRTCCLVGSSNCCESPFPDITLYHIGIHLFPTHFSSWEQQSPASPLSSLCSSAAQSHRGPSPVPAEPWGKLRARHRLGEHKELCVCLTLPRRCSPGHRTAGCIPSFPQRYSGQWPHLTEGEKQERKKESPVSVQASAQSRKQLRPRCSRTFCSRNGRSRTSRKQLLLKSA